MPRGRTFLPAVVVALVVGGCAAAPVIEAAAPEMPAAPAPAPTPASSPPSSVPTVTGAFGERPELTFPDSAPPGDLEARVLIEGEGEVVAAGDLIVTSYLGQVWDGPVFDSSYDVGRPSVFSIGTGAVVEGWDTGLVGRRVGSRVLLAVPPGLSGGSPLSVEDSVVFVVDVLDRYGSEAAATTTARPTGAATGPRVFGDLGAPASVTVPAGTPEPGAPTATVLAASGGSATAAGVVAVQYAATSWDGSQEQSTWSSGAPLAIELGSGGSFDALLGVPVGSRVLLEVPATAAAPALAVVVDVLGQVSTFS